MADVSASFTGSIPEYYDSCLGPAWFDAFGEDLARRLPAKPPGDVLEIACGTGLVTRRLRERLDPSVRLTATDLSLAMLEYARGKFAGRKGVRSPGGLVAYIGRKKYGAKKMAKMNAAGRKRASEG